MMRLFVAIDLPPEIKELLSSICFGLQGARWIPDDQLHLTLRFIGEVDGGLFKDIRELLALINANPFELRLKGVGHFPPRKHPQVLWVGIDPQDALLRLRGKIEAALVREGLEPEGRKYSPHITVARLKDTHAGKAANFLETNGLFASPCFSVENFLLYSSKLTPKGAIHTIEAAYPLHLPLGNP
jgi:2'-5' RNA ligase